MNETIATITKNVPLTDTVYRMVMEGNGLEAQKPGQFVNIRLEGLYLRGRDAGRADRAGQRL